MDDYVSIEFLGSFVGMVAVINLIVQFLKLPLDRWKKIPTRYLVWVISMGISIAYHAIVSTFTPESIFLMLLNSIVLTMAAMGSYASIIKPMEERSDKE
jgi:uncharacterized membrane protein YqhA